VNSSELSNQILIDKHFLTADSVMLQNTTIPILKQNQPKTTISKYNSYLQQKETKTL